MERLTTAVTVAFVGVAAVVLTAVPAGAQGTGVSILRPAQGLRPQVEWLQARASTGTISGTVIDEAGSALRGAMVSALGVTLASTVTDDRGSSPSTSFLPVSTCFAPTCLVSRPPPA